MPKIEYAQITVETDGTLAGTRVYDKTTGRNILCTRIEFVLDANNMRNLATVRIDAIAQLTFTGEAEVTTTTQEELSAAAAQQDEDAQRQARADMQADEPPLPSFRDVN